ncbi:hypothetical protein [Pacificoceanicola onchidii]|uniref:hypothetical protein n=1 Tax=Pacificoceanicola onchidii TaxID=2562685 RepID=UPI0010A5401F|nr:hypothetical protein [Pacificoceanicola onchidii]
MTAVLRSLSQNSRPPSGPDADARALLDHLRHVARANRCKCYLDLFGACAALSGNRIVAPRAASEVLMRCLSQALGRRPILFQEGEAETSFDEAWLMTLASSLKREDEASTTFLLHSRVPKHLHRNVVFLLKTVIGKSNII